jgi:hypothetical protein
MDFHGFVKLGTLQLLQEADGALDRHRTFFCQPLLDIVDVILELLAQGRRVAGLPAAFLGFSRACGNGRRGRWCRRGSRLGVWSGRRSLRLGLFGFLWLFLGGLLFLGRSGFGLLRRLVRLGGLFLGQVYSMLSLILE